jgi:hypothetical protein
VIVCERYTDAQNMLGDSNRQDRYSRGEQKCLAGSVDRLRRSPPPFLPPLPSHPEGSPHLLCWPVEQKPQLLPEGSHLGLEPTHPVAHHPPAAMVSPQDLGEACNWQRSKGQNRWELKGMPQGWKWKVEARKTVRRNRTTQAKAER